VAAAAQASVPYGSLAAAYGNPGISDDSDPAAGNLDGGGRSYSAQALAAAGLTRGARITHGGVTFTWPDRPPGTPDNAVADGQVIALPGAGPALGLLGTGCYGTATGTVTVTFTDGSTRSLRLSLADWWANAPAAGSGILVTVPYINTATGRQNRNVAVYARWSPSVGRGKLVV
jgi:beta-glucosidase